MATEGLCEPIPVLIDLVLHFQDSFGENGKKPESRHIHQVPVLEHIDFKIVIETQRKKRSLAIHSLQDM